LEFLSLEVPIPNASEELNEYPSIETAKRGPHDDQFHGISTLDISHAKRSN
jgi:hypothetical protein